MADIEQGIIRLERLIESSQRVHDREKRNMERMGTLGKMTMERKVQREVLAAGIVKMRADLVALRLERYNSRAEAATEMGILQSEG